MWQWRRFGAALAALTMLAAVAAAGEAGKVEEQDPPEMRKMNYKWEVDASYPELGAEKVDAHIQEWLRAYIAESVEEVKDLAEPTEPKGAWDMWVTYSYTKPSEKYVSVIFEIYTYPYGAAHPSGCTIAKNYVLDTGEELTLDTLFKDPEKALAVFAEYSPAIISNDFQENHPANFPNGLEDADWFKDGFKPTRDNYEVLGLEEGGVRVHFQQYQILPYVFGMPSPLIPLSRLEAAGPNPDIWPKGK